MQRQSLYASEVKPFQQGAQLPDERSMRRIIGVAFDPALDIG
ncbi:hypothetical protein [Ottowia thiooxydans]|nr:hypothetical protein [Ottowia thiooxydans]